MRIIMENVPIVEEFIELASIDASSRKERAIADVLIKKLKDIGLTVHEDDTASKVEGEAGNIIAYLKGTLPGSVLFCAHIDRAQNGCGIKPRIEDGRIVSDGSTILAADDLSGVCAILDGLRRIVNSGKPHPRVEVVLTVSEEIGLQGSRCLDYSKLQSKIGYVLDSAGRIGRVLKSAMGKAELFMDVTGTSAHAAYPELGISATRAAILALSRLEDGRVDDETVINWSYFVSPTPCNVIPDKASCKAFAMSRNNDKLQSYINKFIDVANQTATETGAKIDARFVKNYPAYHVSPEKTSISLIRKAFDRLGIECKIEHGAGGCDANRLNGNGIECIALATGYSKNHTVNEELIVEDLIRSGETVAAIIEEYAHI